jgi:hypothetical protein
LNKVIFQKNKINVNKAGEAEKEYEKAIYIDDDYRIEY